MANNRSQRYIANMKQAKKNTYWKYVKDKFDAGLKAAPLTLGLSIWFPIYAKENFSGLLAEPKITYLPLVCFSLYLLYKFHRAYVDWSKE